MGFHTFTMAASRKHVWSPLFVRRYLCVGEGGREGCKMGRKEGCKKAGRGVNGHRIKSLRLPLVLHHQFCLKSKNCTTNVKRIKTAEIHIQWVKSIVATDEVFVFPRATRESSEIQNCQTWGQNDRRRSETSKRKNNKEHFKKQQVEKSKVTSCVCERPSTLFTERQAQSSRGGRAGGRGQEAALRPSDCRGHELIAKKFTCRDRKSPAAAGARFLSTHFTGVEEEEEAVQQEEEAVWIPSRPRQASTVGHLYSSDPVRVPYERLLKVTSTPLKTFKFEGFIVQHSSLNKRRHGFQSEENHDDYYFLTV